MIHTQGIVIDAGASEDCLQNSYYDDKLKVRIPEIHGFGDLATGFKSKDSNSTKDKDIPWSTITCASLSSQYKYTMLSYKAQHFGVGDVVYVSYEDSRNVINVVGSKTRYVEGETIYNGIDVSDLVEKSSKFPSILLSPATGSKTEVTEDTASKDGDATTSIENKTAWKTIFGNPFTDKKLYTITSNFGPHGYPSGGAHSGLDLAGSTGTPIYAAGDGTVVKVNSMGSAFGNHVVIDHGRHRGLHLYSLYGHMNHTPLVSVGQKVKGTQIAAPKWEKGKYYYSKNNIVDATMVLTSKPKDWSENFGNYYKQLSGGRKFVPVTGERQKGTHIGNRGSTGNSTGPHLHFMFTDNLSFVSNSQVGSGHIKDPKRFITF